MKMSLIVFGALAVSFLLRRRSAALRHWVLAAGVAVRGGHADADCRLCRHGRCHSRRRRPSRHIRIRSGSGSGVTIGGARATASHRNWSGRCGARSCARGVDRRLRFRRRAARRSGWPGTVVALAILLTGVLRLAWLAMHARRITHGRWHDLAAGNFARLRTAASGRDIAAEHTSVIARHLGPRAAEGDSCRLPLTRGPTNARASCCRTSSRTSAAATGLCSCLPSCCARSTGSIRCSGLPAGVCGSRASTRATTR